MNAKWQSILMKLDAMTLRERVMIFVAAMAVVILFVNTVFLDPLSAKQKKLSVQLRQAQNEITGIQLEIEQKLQLHAIDPDLANRTRLNLLKTQTGQKRDDLHKIQKNLVAPEKIATLLESVLKQNAKLRLLSLKTLAGAGLMAASGEIKDAKEDGNALAAKINAPATDKTAPAPAVSAAAASGSAPQDEPIFRHGVEIVVQGSYLELLAYMAELEKMPWQLYWGSVQLEVDAYPKATLTMNVFTLSLDRKWLNL